jgi:hypothetical protein
VFFNDTKSGNWAFHSLWGMRSGKGHLSISIVNVTFFVVANYIKQMEMVGLLPLTTFWENTSHDHVRTTLPASFSFGR